MVKTQHQGYFQIVQPGIAANRNEEKLKKTQKILLNAVAATILISASGCTLLGIGIGAVAGSGTEVGMLGGAVIGGVIGHEIGD